MYVDTIFCDFGMIIEVFNFETKNKYFIFSHKYSQRYVIICEGGVKYLFMVIPKFSSLIFSSQKPDAFNRIVMDKSVNATLLIHSIPCYNQVNG